MSIENQDLENAINTLKGADEGIRKFKSDFTERLDVIERKANINRLNGDPVNIEAKPTTAWRETQTGKPVLVLERKHALASLDESEAKDTPSLGRVLRGIILGGQADDAKELAEERKALAITPDSDGGYTVAGALSSRWIDALRARTVLIQAGALTVPMDSASLSLARVDSDPTVSWHAENAALTSGGPTFGAINLRARTAVALVKMSLELAQDSANIEQILQSTLTNALAGALDSAGLNGVAADAAAAPTGVFNTAGINTLSTVGAPTSYDPIVDAMYELLADNVAMEDISAFIAHPAVWKKFRKLKTGISSDNTPLVQPDEVARLPKLWTTAAPLTGGTTAKGMVADWRSLLFGMRKQISVQVLRESFMGSNLQVAVLAYCRADFAVTRPTDFCVLPGITV